MLTIFQSAIRKSMAGVKGGEAVFKLDTELAGFNAFSSI
jgi:hypothetical protein